MSNIVNQSDVPVAELNIKDKSDPRSMVNIVSSSAVADAIMSTPDDLFMWDEQDLKEKAKPSPTDEIIKMSFWNEYDLASARIRKLDITNVWIRSCTRDYFFKKFITNSFKVAWLLTPPPSYSVMLDLLLAKGQAKLAEVLSQPLIQPMKDGEGRIHYQVDSKLADTIAKITMNIDNRKYGAVPQFIKSEMRSVNVNVNQNQQTSQEQLAGGMSEIDAKIKRLESQLGITKAVDAQYTEVTKKEE